MHIGRDDADGGTGTDGRLERDYSGPGEGGRFTIYSHPCDGQQKLVDEAETKEYLKLKAAGGEPMRAAC